MDVEDILRSAADAVDKAEVPSEFRAIAFEKAVEVFAARSTSGVLDGSDDRTGELRSGPTQADGNAGMARVAERLDIDVEAIAEVFDDANGELQIIVAPSKMPSNKSGATKLLALLVAAGRQAGGYDEGWTPSAVIRDVCRDYGKLDSANFATALAGMKDEFSFRGKGQGREVKVTRPGFELAARHIRRLTGVGGDLE
jgi:hypothetical protein